MFTPIEQFSSLSLRSPMIPQANVPPFNDRKRDVQDILSSFSKDTLPSEYRSEVFISINESQDPSDLTIAGDLQGSLMQWGTHDEDAYHFLSRIQPESTRSILFHQKVARRLEAAFDSYSDIDRGSPASEIRDQVIHISNDLRTIVDASTYRQKVEGSAHGVDEKRVNLFIDTLRIVCERNLDMAGSGRKTRRSSGSQPEASLFHMLISESEGISDHFILDLLDWVADQFVDVLVPHRNALENIAARLATLKAPIPYQQHFQGVLRKLAASTEIGQNPTAGLPSPPPPPPGPAGKKRPAGNASGRKAGKRGKGT